MEDAGNKCRELEVYFSRYANFIASWCWPVCAAQEMASHGPRALPRPDRLHHIVEDFLTLWTAPLSHVLPLQRFLSDVLSRDVRSYFGDSCLVAALTHGRLPESCQQHFIDGQGLQRPPMFHTATSKAM